MKKKLLVLVLMLSLLLPSTVSAEDSTLWESYSEGGDGYTSTWGVIWFGQTFTTEYPHTITSVKVYGARFGDSQGVLTAYIYETAAGVATGDPTSTGFVYMDNVSTANTWVEFEMDEVSLADATKYALVLEYSDSDADTDTFRWYDDGSSATYAGGSEIYSTDSGGSWDADTDDDYYFRIYGETTFDIVGATVFSGYLEDNDWLITVSYKNLLEPYYSSGDLILDSFILQLTTAGDALIAQTPLAAWGYKPGSIYLSASAVESLEWGSGYKIKMYATGDDHETESYTLTSDDWKGNNLLILDAWCISLAKLMEEYYDEEYIAYTAEKGEVLNEEGSVIFMIGIPYLDQVRPNIFQAVVSSIPHEEPVWTGAYWDTLPTWDENVGPDIAAVLTATGGLVNLSGQNLGALLIILLWVVVSITAVSKAQSFDALCLCSAIPCLGIYYDFIPRNLVFVIILMVIVALARRLKFSNP